MTQAASITMPRARGALPVLANAIERFRAVREGTIRMVKNLTEQQAGFSVSRDRWSIAQILDHLLLTENLYRTQMNKLLDMAREGKRNNLSLGLQEVNLSLPFIPTALMPAMAMPLTLMNAFIPPLVREALLRVPVMKVRNPKIAEPQPARRLNELQSELVTSLAETEMLFAGALPHNADRVTISHPVFGRNNASKLVRLMAAHEQRHQVQISTLLTSPGFRSRGTGQTLMRATNVT